MRGTERSNALRALAFLAALTLAIFAAGCGGDDKAETTAVDKAANETQTATKGVPPAQATKDSEKPTYEKPEVCGACHSEIYDKWRGDMHAIAFVDPLYQAEAQLAGKEAGEEVQKYCHSCHTPAGYMRNESLGDPAKAPDQTKYGIFCDFCHTVKGSSGIGNASYIPDPSGPKRGPYKDAASLFHETAYSELHTKSEFCGMCHNVNHPSNGLVLENTYTEWKEGPYAKAGIQCQDCHMKPAPGRAANSGSDRDKVYSHEVVGANMLVTSLYGFKDHAKAAEKRLKSAAKLKVSAARLGSNAKLKVTIENVGAGHYLPTGLTEVRQMWLYVLVRDAAGKTVYESGRLDEKSAISQGSKLYNTILGDKDGKPTAKVWEAEKILVDNRIPPQGSKTEEFSFPDAGNDLKVEVKLLYRGAPQELLDELTGGKFNVPIVEMAAASARIQPLVK